MTYLVTLINDHSLSGYLFIQEMKGKYDQLLFITTHKMVGSGRGKRIEKTLGLPENSVRRIVISDEDLNEALTELKKNLFSQNDRFIVNLSSDQMILTLSAYTYFSTYQTSFYHIPIGKNEIENIQTSGNIPLHYRVNIKEYLTLHGLRFECNDKLCYPKDHTYSLFERYQRAGYNRYKIDEILNAENYPEDSDRRYYSGAWFEEYVYHRIREEKSLQGEFIYTGVKIFRSGSGDYHDNEIDIAYVIDNELHIGECKVSLKGTPGNNGPKLLEQYMYKLAALSLDFGLNVRQFIFTLHRFNHVPQYRMNAIKRRMKILKLEGLIDGDAFFKNRLDGLDPQKYRKT